MNFIWWNKGEQAEKEILVVHVVLFPPTRMRNVPEKNVWHCFIIHRHEKKWLNPKGKAIKSAFILTRNTTPV